jgi:hypothetical protein
MDAKDLHHEPVTKTVVTSRSPEGRVWAVAHVCTVCDRLVSGRKHCSSQPFQSERFATLN